MNNQDSTPPPEPSNRITEEPEKDNIAEAQDKDFKMAVMNMFRDLREVVNKFFKEAMKTLKEQLNTILKIFQDMKVKIKSLKKIQTEVELKMKNSKCQTKTSEVSLNNKLEDMGEKISDLDKKLEEMEA